jgi:hypothetical protein
MSRHEVPGSPTEDLPPELPRAGTGDSVQTPEDGVGPLFHRRYRVRIGDAELAPAQVMQRVAADPNCVAPSEFASFHRLEGGGPMRVDDDWVVRMPGPWDGPVRVVDVSSTSFRLATLRRHLEAGQIEFRCRQDHDGSLCFEIESWARSGDRLSNLLYHHLRMAKEIQLHMWISVLERVVELAGGRRLGRLEIETRRVDYAP